MPFLQEAGPIGAGLPAARLVVDRDKVLALKRGFEDELVRVREWLSGNGRTLSFVPPPGCDPCSGDASKALGQNGDSAIAAMQGYVDQLEKVAAALNGIAIAYGLTEDANTRRLERKCR